MMALSIAALVIAIIALIVAMEAHEAIDDFE